MNTSSVFSDTIAAVSTPMGVGGIAVIRISGKNAIDYAQRVLVSWHPDTSSDNTDAQHIEQSPVARFCRIPDLDDVVVTLFRAPHSFTGEDVVEISCHGSLYIQNELLRRLINAGCRTARAGEFTSRAFLNGKMDLSEAEAVADLIASQSEAEKNLALKQMRGGLSSQLQSLRDQLLHFTSLIELELDFADHEDLEFVNRGELQELATKIDKHLTQLTDSFAAGNAIKNGIAVAIVGAPNAGKSTLLNALLGEERAIVSEIQGTTRDTIEDTLYLGGLRFRLIDTAGIRNTSDPLEQMGVERSQKAIENAHIVVQVVDASEPQFIPLSLHNGQRYIVAYNKSDLVGHVIPCQTGDQSYVVLSAKNKDISTLRDALIAIGQQMTSVNSVAVSNIRHYEALSRALMAIKNVEKGLEENVSGELLSLDLQDCLTALGEITGQITSQEVLNQIFSKFCIGK